MNYQANINASTGPFIYACLKILIVGQQLLRFGYV